MCWNNYAHEESTASFGTIGVQLYHEERLVKARSFCSFPGDSAEEGGLCDVLIPESRPRRVFTPKMDIAGIPGCVGGHR